MALRVYILSSNAFFQIGIVGNTAFKTKWSCCLVNPETIPSSISKHPEEAFATKEKRKLGTMLIQQIRHEELLCDWEFQCLF